MMATKFTLGTLLHWGCNQTLTRTTQVSGNCGQGCISSAFMSKVSIFCIIARIKGINVSTYFYTSEVRTEYPSLVWNQCFSIFSFLCSILYISLFVFWPLFCLYFNQLMHFTASMRTLKSQWRVEVGWICIKAYSNGRQ